MNYLESFGANQEPKGAPFPRAHRLSLHLPLLSNGPIFLSLHLREITHQFPTFHNKCSVMGNSAKKLSALGHNLLLLIKGTRKQCFCTLWKLDPNKLKKNHPSTKTKRFPSVDLWLIIQPFLFSSANHSVSTLRLATISILKTTKPCNYDLPQEMGLSGTSLLVKIH